MGGRGQQADDWPSWGQLREVVWSLRRGTLRDRRLTVSKVRSGALLQRVPLVTSGMVLRRAVVKQLPVPP
jgi:hypothetical protein